MVIDTGLIECLGCGKRSIVKVFELVPMCPCGCEDWRDVTGSEHTVQIPAKQAFPHKCPKCASPAYIGFSSVECSAGCKF